MEITKAELSRSVKRIGGDIIQSKRFIKARSVRHHSKEGNIALHSFNTAIYGLAISRWLFEQGITVNEEDVVRACLLHDIGMTEDSVFLSPSRVKAYTHPREGSRIARREYGVNDVQADAIRRHMWPIGHVPPHSIEGWIVVAADKSCSIQEARKAAMRILGRLMSFLVLPLG